MAHRAHRSPPSSSPSQVPRRPSKRREGNGASEEVLSIAWACDQDRLPQGITMKTNLCGIDLSKSSIQTVATAGGTNFFRRWKGAFCRPVATTVTFGRRIRRPCQRRHGRHALESGDRETSLPPHDAATADREIRHMTDGGDHETENPEG